MSQIYRPEGRNPFEEEPEWMHANPKNSKSLNPFEDDNPPSSRTRTAHPENRILKTICLYTAFFTMGFTHNSMGPTLVQMELWLETDTKTLSWVFTAFSAGYVIGSVICGLIFDRLNAELTFLVSGVGIALAFCLGPSIGGLYGYIIFMLIGGIFSGYIDAGGNGYSVCLWEDSRWKEPILQGLHMTWSIGGTIGPLIVRPFLKDIHPDGSGPGYCNTENGLNVTTHATQPLPTTFEVIVSNVSHSLHGGYKVPEVPSMEPNTTAVSLETYGSIRFAYLTIGLMSLVAPALYAVVFVCNGPSFFRKSADKKTKAQKAQDERTKQSGAFVIALLTMMFIFYMFYLILEVSPGNFLAAFAIKELCWPNYQGALITSVLWGAHGVGRLIGVPISAFVPAKIMLIINLTMQISAYGLLFFVHFHPAVLWVSAAVLGLGMSTTFATGVLWASQYLVINGVSAAVFMIGSSVGSTTSPIFVGYLFDTFSPMWLIYIGFTAAVLQCLTFIVADVFARKKYQASPVGTDNDVGATAYKGAELEPLKAEKHTNF